MRNFKAYHLIFIVLMAWNSVLSFDYTSLSPEHLAVDVPVDTLLMLTFPAPIQTGAGQVAIHRVWDSALVEAIPVTDSTRVNGAGTNVITIDPETLLAPNTSYFVQVDAAAFVDAERLPFIGILRPTQWQFTTAVDSNQFEIELLLNGGFELSNEPPELPRNWTANAPTESGGLVCDQAAAAYSGRCAYQFSAGQAAPRRLQ